MAHVDGRPSEGFEEEYHGGLVPYLCFPNGLHGPKKVILAEGGLEAIGVVKKKYPKALEHGIWVRVGGT